MASDTVEFPWLEVALIWKSKNSYSVDRFIVTVHKSNKTSKNGAGISVWVVVPAGSVTTV